MKRQRRPVNRTSWLRVALNIRLHYHGGLAPPPQAKVVSSITTLKAIFKQHFSTPEVFVQSPGRINVLGEHTDYNDGFVLPAAITQAATFAASLNQSSEYRFVSLDMNETFSTDTIAPTQTRWVNYLLGVLDQLQKQGVAVPGFDLVFGGNIPIGAGVSSSAAIECGLLVTLNHLLQLGLDRKQMALMAQAAEHQYAGVKCGIMDQFAVLHGQKDHAIRLDCRTLDFETIPLKLGDYRLVLADTGVKHSHASSAYNLRREECEACVAALNTLTPIQALRDASAEQLKAVQSTLKSEAYLRGQYVIAENARVLAACDALKHNQLDALGELMWATHDGLQTQFEVSCPEADRLVELARHQEGVLGARMMGGGFGGFTLNLIHQSAIEDFTQRLKHEYYDPKSISPNVIITSPADGTHVLTTDS